MTTAEMTTYAELGDESRPAMTCRGWISIAKRKDLHIILRVGL